MEKICKFKYSFEEYGNCDPVNSDKVHTPIRQKIIRNVKDFFHEMDNVLWIFVSLAAI